MKYLVFNDSDQHIFKEGDRFEQGHPFCLVDAQVDSDMDLEVSALLLDDATKAPLDNQLGPGNKLAPTRAASPPYWPPCVTFAGLEAADVKIWITYDREGGGDPGTDGDGKAPVHGLGQMGWYKGRRRDDGCRLAPVTVGNAIEDE